MARIRSIHPGLFTDEDYMALSPYAMAALPGIWVEADDQGVFAWKPLTIKARLLPNASVDMSDILAEYEARGMVRRFEHSGKLYGAVRNFRRFQRPEKPKATHPITDDIAAYVGLSATNHTGADKSLPPLGDQSPTVRQPVADASPTTPRKSGQMEDGGGNGEEERASAPPDAIWFEGQALRLNRRDFEAWEQRFGEAYPDFWDELWRIDGKLAHEGLTGSKAFLKAEGWLNHGLTRWRKQRAPPNAEHLQVVN